MFKVISRELMAIVGDETEFHLEVRSVSGMDNYISLNRVQLTFENSEEEAKEIFEYINKEHDMYLFYKNVCPNSTIDLSKKGWENKGHEIITKETLEETSEVVK